MKILYCGSLSRWGTAEARRRALLDLGHEVVAVDELSYVENKLRILRNIQRHLLIGPGVVKYNHELIRMARATRPEIIWIDQGILLWPGTVRTLHSTHALLLCYTSDYFGHQEYVWRYYLSAIGLYDVHVVTNKLNVPKLQHKGARKIIKAEFGYDPALHRPPRLTQEDRVRYKADAIFIGHWEPTTEQMILHLKKYGLRVKVWGTGWKKARHRHLLDSSDGIGIQPIFGEDYVKALAASKICLCFLSKWNRNQSAGRTFEIPAIGGFLLGERTPDHLGCYEEGRHAEFFGTAQEMVQKALYYLGYEGHRQEIARAGHEHCLSSGYRHQDRVRQILQSL